MIDRKHRLSITRQATLLDLSRGSVYYWTCRQNLSRPHRMKSVVCPELSTASAGSSQAPTAAVDNSAPLSTHTEPTYKSGATVQITGTTPESLLKMVP